MKYFLVREKSRSKKLIVDVLSLNNQEIETFKNLLLNKCDDYDLISIINDMDWIKEKKFNIVSIWKFFPIDEYFYQSNGMNLSLYDKNDYIKLDGLVFCIWKIRSLSEKEIDFLIKIWQNYRVMLKKTKSVNIKVLMSVFVKYLDMIENHDLKTLLVVKNIIT